MSVKQHGNFLPDSRSEAKLYTRTLSVIVLPVTSHSLPCHKSISLYLQQRLKISCIKPLDVPRKNLFLYAIIFEEISLVIFFESYFFQKYRSFSKSSRLENGSTPANNLTIEGDVDLGAPKRFFKACVWKCSNFLTKPVISSKLLTSLLIDLTYVYTYVKTWPPYSRIGLISNL